MEEVAGQGDSKLFSTTDTHVLYRDNIVQGTKIYKGSPLVVIQKSVTLCDLYSVTDQQRANNERNV